MPEAEVREGEGARWVGLFRRGQQTVMISDMTKEQKSAHVFVIKKGQLFRIYLKQLQCIGKRTAIVCLLKRSVDAKNIPALKRTRAAREFDKRENGRRQKGKLPRRRRPVRGGRGGADGFDNY